MILCANLCPRAAGQRWAFYTGQHRYRFGPDDDRCAHHRLCNLEIFRGKDHPEQGGREQRDYSLNFIEFKDDGTLYDRSQIESALKQIRDAGRDNDGNVLVFLYAHGWHNSAEERAQPVDPDCAERLYTGDVDKFRHCGLEVLANNSGIDTPAGKAPRIVGIYLAWHGWDFGWPPFVWVPSYFLRMPAARSIGLTGMAEAVQAVFDTVVEQRTRYPQPDSFFTIAMGHSFGARVLEAALDGVPRDATRHGILRKLRDESSARMPNHAAGPRIGPHSDRLPVDMVFYANAATSHADTIRTLRSWETICRRDPSVTGCGQNPLYYAVSSRADVLTAVVMPVANLVAMPFGYLLRGTHYSNGYHIISAANTPWMQTHAIPRYESRPPADSPPNGFCFKVPDWQKEPQVFVVDAKPGHENAKQWAMNSDHWSASLVGLVHKIPPLRPLVQSRWVIGSHGDVWNTGVFNMVRSVVETQAARAADPQAIVPCRTQKLDGQALRAKP